MSKWVSECYRGIQVVKLTDKNKSFCHGVRSHKGDIIDASLKIGWFAGRSKEEVRSQKWQKYTEVIRGHFGFFLHSRSCDTWSSAYRALTFDTPNSREHEEQTDGREPNAWLLYPRLSLTQWHTVYNRLLSPPGESNCFPLSRYVQSKGAPEGTLQEYLQADRILQTPKNSAYCSNSIFFVGIHRALPNWEETRWADNILWWVERLPTVHAPITFL